MARNPNRMQEAVDILMGRFQQSASVVVTYSDGSVTIPGISATVGRTRFEVEAGGVMIAHESRDYLIAQADLVSAGVQMIPRSGAHITEADGRVYEVAIPKPYNVYESIGPASTVFKIHTIGPK